MGYLVQSLVVVVMVTINIGSSILALCKRYDTVGYSTRAGISVRDLHVWVFANIDSLIQ